ncbi:MAG: HAD family hydrolase [Candidatus Rokubacteria bacterium]|nr:HAD family hydrolase [Candidatus Rokubacteria bacterium]
MSSASPAPLRAVFFDAGNTLIRMDYAAMAAALGAHGAAVDPERLERAEWRARVRVDADLLARPESTESSGVGERYVTYLLDEAGVRDPRVVGALLAWRRRYNPPLGLWTAAAPRAAEAVRLARRAGLRTGVISNSNGTVRSVLASLGLADHLDFVLDSHEVGVEKPDPRIFRLALERAGVTAAEAAYIGDLYSVDVLGARGAGLAAVLLDPGGCWGRRDCPRAPDALAAVRRLLEGAGDPATPSAG